MKSIDEIIFVFCMALIVFVAGDSHGMRTARHECPTVQQGERLLSTEQRTDGTICVYAEGEAGYGRKIIRRRSK